MGIAGHGKHTLYLYSFAFAVCCTGTNVFSGPYGAADPLVHGFLDRQLHVRACPKAPVDGALPTVAELEAKMAAC